MAPEGPDVSALPTSYKFIVNSCGDIKGPTMEAKARPPPLPHAIKAAGYTAYVTPADDKAHYSKTWEYMQSLNADAIYLLGDNVYNDGIQAGGSKGYGAPYGNNVADHLADASHEFAQVHGYEEPDGSPGQVYQAYLEILTDKIHDGFSGNAEFLKLKAAVDDSVHVTWDDHDYLANDPSNPHPLRAEFRAVEVDALTGWDSEFFRFPPGSNGLERSWERTFNNKGSPFVVRFIILDEETTHLAACGMKYVFDSTSKTGFKPVRASGSDQNTSTLNCDLRFVEDFESQKRPYFGESQTSWFVKELSKPADLRLVFNGAPNFELDYSYASLSDFPGAKRHFIEALRISKAEHVVFFGGDSHATYVTKVPDVVGYPMYTVIGSGMTQGLSYDKYVGYWGDISHRHMVAAGSTNRNNNAASFAVMELVFDPEPMLVFTPHMADDASAGDVAEADAKGRWGPWYEQSEANAAEPWAARYEIKVGELVNAPNAAVDSNRFVPETIYIKYAPPAVVAADQVANVVLTLKNASDEAMSFNLVEGDSYNLCGSGFWGLCKDMYGAFTYATPTAESYTPSHEQRKMCEHAGLVGDEIAWTIVAKDAAGDVLDAVGGRHTLLIRNNALLTPAFDSDACSQTHGSSKGGVGCTIFLSTQVSYGRMRGPSVGVSIGRIVAEPPFYAGHLPTVVGFDRATGEFENVAIQALFVLFKADPVVANEAALSAAYLRKYYPSIEGM
ncbi:hypothetical protein M885DRAFT_618001 [Pelagophyceae sp. CCMP2097]|nr:hypothetical protein M885DRAFT_618001 [Pelagophyceae sp. CCMP2097]